MNYDLLNRTLGTTKVDVSKLCLTGRGENQNSTDAISFTENKNDLVCMHVVN